MKQPSTQLSTLDTMSQAILYVFHRHPVSPTQVSRLINRRLTRQLEPARSSSSINSAAAHRQTVGLAQTHRRVLGDFELIENGD